MNWEAVGAISEANRVRELLLLNPDLVDLMTKGYASYTTLDTTAKIRFGLLDEILRNPGVREWLQGKKPDWRPAFHELVDERLALFQQDELGE